MSAKILFWTDVREFSITSRTLPSKSKVMFVVDDRFLRMHKRRLKLNKDIRRTGARLLVQLSFDNWMYGRDCIDVRLDKGCIPRKLEICDSRKRLRDKSDAELLDGLIRKRYTCDDFISLSEGGYLYVGPT